MAFVKTQVAVRKNCLQMMSLLVTSLVTHILYQFIIYIIDYRGNIQGLHTLYSSGLLEALTSMRKHS